MIGGKWFDMIVGIDIHWVMVPTPAPVPTPLPHPFAGLIYDPMGLAVGTAIGAAIGAIAGAPPTGPVLINCIPASATGTEGTNKMIMPHIPTPPGVSWAGVPAGIKPPIPGKKANPGAPVPMPSNDAIIITGSKTVYIMGTNATRLGDLVMSCGEPVRLPSSTVIAVPMGPPVIIGGPPALDFIAAFMGLIRTSWVSGRLNALAGRVFGAGSRGARWASKVICMVTGHPVDVISGMVLTDAVDVALPGPIAFRFERNYASRSDNNGPLGYGWSHPYDQSIRFESRRIVYRAGDGRDIYFPRVDLMQFVKNESEGLELRRDRHVIVIQGKDRVRYVFGPPNPDKSMIARATGQWPLLRIEDQRGQKIEFRYDALGRLSEATDSAQRLIGFEHDDNGWLKSISLPHPTQAGGRFVAARYQYDDQGDLVAVHDALDQPTRYAYKHHLLVQETDRNDFSFYFAYDGVSPEARCVRTWGDGGLFDHVLTYDVPKRVTVKEDSYGSTTIYHGNEAGLVEKMVDSLGRTRTFQFDQASRTILETDPTGAAIVIEYDAGGNIASVQNADGERRAYKYDEFDQEILETVGEKTELRYDYTTYGELLDTRNPHGGGFRHAYAANGDLISIASRSGRRLSFTWDNAGNPTSLTAPGEETIHAKYDALGTQVEQRYPSGEVVRFNRDLLGRTTSLSSSLVGTSKYEYDGEGNVVRWTGPGGNVLTYTLGQFNKLLAVDDPGRGRRRFEYDKEGDVVAVVNEKGERLEYVRNSEGQVTQITDFSGRKTTFAYDAAGRIAKIGDQRGKQRSLKWTPGGRLKEVAYADGCFEKYEYNSLGAIVAVENEAGKLSRTFDLIGRLVGEKWNDFSLTHEYDLDDSRTTTRSSDGTVQRYEYDAGGRPSRLEWNDRWMVRRAYNTRGQLIQSELPGEQIEKRSYDASGNLFEQRVDRRGRGLLSGRQYQFNKAGELSAIFDRQRGNTAYVVGHQGLEKVLRDQRIVESYKFDSTGNRLSSEPTELGKGGRLLRQGDIHYRYDDEGRVIEKSAGDQTWRYDYNDRGQMIKVVTPDEREIQFAYDPMGRRVLKRSKDRETRWTWLDNRPFRHDDRAGGRTTTTHYFFEPDSMTPLGAAVDGKYFNLITDHLGTPQEAFDERGGVAWAGDYMAWGKLRRSLSPGFANPLRFPGQWHDEETGLHYNMHRYYDPDTARYLTPDPIGLEGGFNFYSYPLNPLTWVDHLGLAGCVRTFIQSWKIFIMSGIRPKHARAIIRVCEREGVEAGFRNIKWWKRAQSAFQGMLGVPPKPMPVKGKVGPLGTVTENGVPYRSDYDPTFYRGKDGKVLTNDEALALNQKINNEIGSNEIQHGTHNTMDQAGVPPEKIKEIGPPGDTTVIRPDGSSTPIKNSDMIADPSVPWLW